MKRPDWWPHSQNNWEELWQTVFRLKLAETKQLAHQHHWQLLEGGVANHSYRLKFDEADWFIQIPSAVNLNKLPAQQFFPVNRQLEKLSAIKPHLAYCHYESEQLKIFQWIDARPISTTRLLEPQSLHHLTQFLAALHSSQCQLPTLDMPAQLKHFYRLAVDKNPGQQAELKQMLRSALTLAKDFTPLATCHNDLSPTNILANEQLYFVDWEYACISDPLFELAGIGCNFQLNQSQLNLLIENYDEQTNSKTNLDKLAQMRALYLLVCQLWNG